MSFYGSIIEQADDARTRIKEVTIAEIEGGHRVGCLFLDVREPEEFRSGHLEGAINLPRGDIEAQISLLAPDKDSLIVAYCAVGHRSAIAADLLQDLGYRNVVSLKGGLKALESNESLLKVA